MALRDQPYLPLYVQDFLTDEKLNECSAESTGVYIRLMCIMHKSENYGTILLKQKDKQTDKQILNFAKKLARQMPYEVPIIERALTELLEENVLSLDGDILYQKRMVRDGKLSDIRAFAGRKGAKSRKDKSDIANDFANDFATAKHQANAENEDEDVYINNTSSSNSIDKHNTEDSTLTVEGEKLSNFGQALYAWQDKISPTPSSIVVDGLKTFSEHMDAAVISRAMDIALAERKTSWSYIKAILNRYKNENVRTVEDAIQADAEFGAKKGVQKDGRSSKGNTKRDWNISGITKL